MSKILKNTTSSPIPIADTGITIAAMSSYLIPPQDYLLWAASVNVLTPIGSGAIVVNDGLRDLSATYGAYHIAYSDEAFKVRFLSDPDRVNGFTSKSVQDAIEEAKNIAGNKIRYLTSCGFDGNATTGRYLEFSSNVDSNKSGFIVAIASVFKEISLSVESTSTVTFRVYTWNGTTETQIGIISLASARKGNVSGLSVSLSVLTEIRVKCTAGSCSRPIFFMMFNVS